YFDPNTPGVQSADQFQAGYQPDARVDDLEINTSTGLLVAGTHGRGIWQFQVRPYVSGLVFEDKNGNGIRDENGNGVQDAGDDLGIANVRVVANRIEPAPPIEAANTLTLDDPLGQRTGIYTFRSLENGTYQITGGDASRVPVDTTHAYFVTTPDRVYQLDQSSTIPTADIG